MIYVELRSVNTHPGAKGATFLRRLKRKIPKGIQKEYFRSDSTSYQKDVVETCKKEGCEVSITAGSNGPLIRKAETLPQNAWQQDKKNPAISFMVNVFLMHLAGYHRHFIQ